MIRYCKGWPIQRPTGETISTLLLSDHFLTEISFVAEWIAEGHRLVHKNLVITISRLLRLPSSPQTSPSTVLPQLDALALVDPTGAFVLEARVRIEDRAKPTLVSAASDELNAFRELMRGSIDMRAPERLALDTRVR